MAAGAFAPIQGEWFAVPNLAAGAPDGSDWATGPRGLYDTSPTANGEAGALTVQLPTSPQPYAAKPGARQASYFDDFYNRIHVTPPRIDFGAVSDRAQAAIRVWSAYYDRSTQLTGVAYPAAEGLELRGPPTPVTFGPLAIKTFTLTATQEGPAVIDEELIWTFDIPWSFTLPVTGNRSKAWLFEPSWPPSGQTYQITYSFLTEVIVSRSGREQRIANRSSPRRSVAYQCLLAHDKLREFKDLMWHWQHRAFVLPELTRFIDSQLAQEIDTASMTFAQVPSWMVPGATVWVAFQGFTELRTVDHVEGNAVVFRNEATAVWPAGTRAYPALTGNMASTMSAPSQTNAVAQLDLRFDVTPLSEPRISPPLPERTFNGRELFLKKPNWAQAVNSEVSHEVQTLDYGRGPVARFAPVKYGYEVRQATYLNRNAAEAEEIREFFYRLKGRQGEFYMPTWEYDFVPKTAAPAGTYGLRIAGTTFAGQYGESTVHKAVFVLMHDGSLVLRKVLSVAAVSDSSGEDSLIQVEEAWDREISVDKIVMCGWMPAWRMVSDNLTVEWLTNSVAQVTLNMMTLEDLPAETA